MKDIASNRIRGPEAILVSAVAWWADTDPALRDAVYLSLENASPESFTSFHEWDLGESCGRAVEEAISAFWSRASADPGVKHMIEQAVLAWIPDADVQERIRSARNFVRRLIMTEAGRLVKASGFLERNAASIGAARRAKKRKRR